MVAVVRSVVEIDYVDGRHTALDEGQVIVIDRFFGLEEIVLVAEFLCSLTNQVHQPCRGTGFALNIEILVADHVGEHESLDAAQRAVAAPLRREVAAAIGRVGGRPLLIASSPSKKTSHTE